MSERILIIDDEKDMLVLLRRILSDGTDYEVTTTDNPARALELIRESPFDVVLSDLKMPKLGGLQLLEAVKQTHPGTAVVIMTAYATIESAIEATRKGAFDYITKPFRKERIRHVIEQAAKWQRLQSENQVLREELEGKQRCPALIGGSPAIVTLKRQIERVAGTSATVLITGESGTGKEVVANTLHLLGPRKDKPFIPINCTSLPESVIESELFGHLKGSFTGAHKDKKGLVEEANHGTLFLDEIGDLSPSMQVKLLRLLQEGEYKPIGANTIRRVQVRFLAATHQNLPEKIRRGEFREDLFYRLNVVNIHIPSLAERMEDIPLLCRHFLAKYNALHGKTVERVSEEVFRFFARRKWPGNVRELENMVERGVVMSTGASLEMQDVASSEAPLPTPGEAVPLTEGDDIYSLPFKEAKDRLIEEFQTAYISKVLARHSGNVSQAAKDLGLKRQYLHRLMRETNIDSRSFKKTE